MPQPSSPPPIIASSALPFDMRWQRTPFSLTALLEKELELGSFNDHTGPDASCCYLLLVWWQSLLMQHVVGTLSAKFALHRCFQAHTSPSKRLSPSWLYMGSKATKQHHVQGVLHVSVLSLWLVQCSGTLMPLGISCMLAMFPISYTIWMTVHHDSMQFISVPA